MSNSKAILTADNEPKRGEKPEKRDTEEDNREEKGELINNQNGHSKKTTTPDGDIDDPDFPNTAPVAPPIVEKDIYSSQSKTAVTKPIENAENLADTVIIERNGDPEQLATVDLKIVKKNSTTGMPEPTALLLDVPSVEKTFLAPLNRSQPEGYYFSFFSQFFTESCNFFLSHRRSYSAYPRLLCWHFRIKCDEFHHR